MGADRNRERFCHIRRLDLLKDSSTPERRPTFSGRIPSVQHVVQIERIPAQDLIMRSVPATGWQEITVKAAC